MKDKIDITISVINWNTSDMLGRCIESVLNSTKLASFELFVIDNDSSDDFHAVSQRFSSGSRVTFIQNRRNELLLAKNISYERARGRYFCALGPDATVEPDCIARLYEFLEEHPGAGAVTANLVNPDGSPQMYYRRLLTPWNFIFSTHFGKKIDALFFRNFYRGHFTYEMLDTDMSSEVEQPPGDACFMVRRAALQGQETIVDPKIPFYFSDVDICKRIYGNGYHIYLVGAAHALHQKASSSGRASREWRNEAHRRGMEAYFRKHYPLIAIVIILIARFDQWMYEITRPHQKILAKRKGRE